MKSGVGMVVRLCAAGALVVGLAGCGGDDPVRPPVVVVTPEPVRAILAQTSFPGFTSGNWVSVELILSQRGVLDITVDWTFPTTWMYVYLGRNNCSLDQLSGHTCPFFLTSETKDPKPRVLVTSKLDPGTYYLVLNNVQRDPLTGNGSDNTEAVAIQLGLTVEPGDQRVPGGVALGRTQVLNPH